MINFEDYIESIPDFPKEGILYRDIQPLLEDDFVFSQAIKELGSIYEQPTYWVGVESRGFLLAGALAMKFGGGIKLIRKKGKLPNKRLFSVSYGLEYGKDVLEKDSFVFAEAREAFKKFKEFGKTKPASFFREEQNKFEVSKKTFQKFSRILPY